MSGKGARYVLRVRGHLGLQWSDWFDGFTVAKQANGETTIAGEVPDQPALHRLLVKIRDLGLPLISVECVERGEP